MPLSREMKKVVLDLTQKAISAKVDPLSIINDGLIAGMKT